jgi:hypothetical protein
MILNIMTVQTHGRPSFIPHDCSTTWRPEVEKASKAAVEQSYVINDGHPWVQTIIIFTLMFVDSFCKA